MTIYECSMLANLTIHQWTARRHDRNATQQVDKANGANDAGRYNKLLVDKAALEPITKAANALRLKHYEMTLPWGDNGDRLLPSSLFMDYTQATRELEQVFTTAVGNFVRDYPVLIQDARKRLGALYEPGDYPPVSQIQSRFGVHIGFAPVAQANDFRVDVGEEHVQRIREAITKQSEQRLNDAMKECWQRVREVLERYAARMSDEKGRVYDSMRENAVLLVKLLPSLNVTNDPELARVAKEIETHLLPHSTAKLRNNAVARQTVAEAANDIMWRVKWA